jgi:hypothetical protein
LFRCEADSILPTLLMRRLAVVSTGWKTMSSARPAHPVFDQTSTLAMWLLRAPAPKNRAVLDSLLNSLADELVPAATCATFATASDGMGDIVMWNEGQCN